MITDKLKSQPPASAAENRARVAERAAALDARSATRSDTRFTVTDPVTGTALGTLPLSSPAQVVDVATEARLAQTMWAERPVGQRAAIVRRFAEIVMDRRDELLDLIQVENGKARLHAFDEVLDVVQVCAYYAGAASGLLKTRRRAGAFPFLTSVQERRQAKGLVAVVAPWNYPFSTGVSDSIPALLAGNAVLLKPDQNTPYSSLWAAQALAEAGLPSGLFNVVTGSGSTLGESLVEECDYVMFTGSTRVGQILATHAATHLKDYSLELGGKNAMLVLDDADIKKTARGAVRACFSNSGQLCVSMERMYIDAKVWDEFVPAFLDATRGLALGATLDFSTDFGPLISEGQLRTVAQHVDDAVSKGATVLLGGKARPDLSPTFYEPTILTDVTDQMTLHAEETFGPVVALYRVASENEAIRRANASRYGLNCSIWTSNRPRGFAVSARIQSGNVNINEAYAASWGSVDAPMGGWKDSGVGHRHGEHGLTKYTDVQTLAHQAGPGIAPLPGMDPERFVGLMTGVARAVSRASSVRGRFGA